MSQIRMWRGIKILNVIKNPFDLDSGNSQEQLFSSGPQVVTLDYRVESEVW